MVKKDFPFEVPFINRKKEQKFLLEYFTNQPTNILFVYWPKSTWKTTLIKKVLDQLPMDEYAVNYLDMRWVLVTDFKDFKSLFFPTNIKWKITEIISGIKINVWFFWRSVDDEAMIKTNVFEVMESKLRQANEKWIKPVIIIDEFQYLRNIIINKEDNLTLVQELRKFFIAMTKVEHLAHIVCLTSDSYYMEELYADTKLKNTSKFYLVDHISKTDVQYRLGELEWLSEDIVQYFREYLWWSVWEIRQALVAYKNTWDYKSEIDYLVQDWYGRCMDLMLFKFDDQQKKEFETVSTKIAKEGKFELNLKTWNAVSFQMIRKLVDLDIWFFDPIMQTITANWQSVRKAFQRMFENN